ncbi:MAG TPA: hypothetical protein VHP38_05045, partial [Ruminiclostridium sp.]|nr:hypothetical protein [Ruminiclostridium sp.]
MSISNISGSLNTSSLLYGSGGDNSLDLLNNNMDTSAISGISNIDSYVKSDLMSAQINTTYSPTMPPNPFNVSNITGALNVADSKPDLSGITNLDEYAEAAYSQSQLSVEDQLTNVQGEISGISEISNL